MLARVIQVLLVLLLAVMVSACAVIAGIFKAGFWLGIVVACIVVVLLFALFGRKG
jgi:hypothetical protein